MRPSFFTASLLIALSAPAWVQAAAMQPVPPATPAAPAMQSAAPAMQPMTAVRGVIERIAPDRQSLDVKTRDGGERTLQLPRDARIDRVLAATLADIKQGAYVGVAALPGDGDTLKALEVHIFPEALRGAGDGTRPFDLAPGSSMTNGAIDARVDQVDGAQITVAYKGGQKTITLDKSTAIVAIDPGGLGDLMVGAAIVARGQAADGGGFEARRVAVGINGVTPPM